MATYSGLHQEEAASQSLAPFMGTAGLLFDLDGTLLSRPQRLLITALTLVPGYRSLPFVRRLCAIDPATRRLLLYLRQRGFQLGIVTNGRAYKRRAIEALGLTPLMRTVIVSSELAAKKPDPEPFRQAAKDLGLAPQDIVFVGNSVHSDMRGARDVGMRTLLVRPPSQRWRSWLRSLRHPSQEELAADVTTPSLFNLRALLGLRR